MARPPNPKCAQCAKLPRDEAMQVHGADGDGCWNPKRCDDRRYSYRVAPIRNEVRKQRRRAQQGLSQPVGLAEETALPVGQTATSHQPPHQRSRRTPAVAVPMLEVATPHAYLYYFRRAKDAPVHALMAQLWVGDQLRARACFHVTGGGTVQIKAQLLHVLESFSDLAGVKVPYFRDEVELMPDQCPLRPCPLHPEL